jgi:predicted transcriptional regulator
MAETEESQQNLAAIRTDIEQIRAMQRFAAAATPSFRKFVEEHLEDMVGSAEVYLTLQNGPLNLDAIMAVINKSKPQVSKICSHLEIRGLIAKIPDPANKKGRLFVWTDLENVLEVSAIARGLIKKGSKKKN